MQVGELWYGDFSQPHHVRNRGADTRLHAVLDVEINDELLSFLPKAYIEAQNELGPISLHRKVLTETEDLQSFESRFSIPGHVLPLLMMGRLVELMAGATAEIKYVDGGLKLWLNGNNHCALLRCSADEFLFQGLPPGCFLQLRKGSAGVETIKLVVRGVQEDLVSARLGILEGSRIPERSIDLPVA